MSQVGCQAGTRGDGGGREKHMDWNCMLKLEMTGYIDGGWRR